MPTCAPALSPVNRSDLFDHLLAKVAAVAAIKCGIDLRSDELFQGVREVAIAWRQVSTICSPSEAPPLSAPGGTKKYESKSNEVAQPSS